MASITDDDGYRRVQFMLPVPQQDALIDALSAAEAAELEPRIRQAWSSAAGPFPADWRGRTEARTIARQLLFGGKGARKAIRLGKVSQRKAEEFRRGLEDLLWCRSHGQPLGDQTAHWLAGLPNDWRDKLRAFRLVDPPRASTLGEFLEAYVEGRTDAKPATAVVWGHTKRNLIDFFGAGKALREITEGDADDFRRYLVALRVPAPESANNAPAAEGHKPRRKLSENTVRRRCAIAKQFFRAAVRRKLIPANPFAEIRGGVQANDARDFFVTPEMARKVLDTIPEADHEWRLIFALCRWGGLRCSSEIMGLRVSDVHWREGGRGGKFLVHSPKTEPHEWGASRWVPILPELETYLLDACNKAPPGDGYLVGELRGQRGTNANFRTRFRKIIKRAGLTPWPKLFQNLRSPRETELARVHPLHVVCEWIGNSKAIAAKHYL